MEYSAQRRWKLPLFFIFVCACLLFAACTLHTYAQSAEPALTLEVTEASGDAANDLTVVYGDSVTLTATLTGTDIPEGAAVSFQVGALTHSTVIDQDGRAVWIIDALTLAAQSSYTVDVTYGTLSDTATVSVAQRTITYEGITVADKEYDGSNDVVIETNGTLIGVLEGDSVTVNATFKFADQDVGQNKSILLKDYTLQGSKRLNYIFVSPTLTASITPRRVTIEGIVTTPFDYNGLEGQEVEIKAGYALSGILESEADAAYLAGIRATVISPNASDTQGVVFDPSVTYLTGDLCANYELVLPTDITVRINQVKLTLSVDKVTINKGQSIPTLTPKVEGFVNGESMTALVGFVLPTVTPNPVNTLDTALTSFTVAYVDGNATQNYTFDRESHTAVTLEIRTVTATASDYVLSVSDTSVWHKTAITVTPAAGYVSLTTGTTDGSLTAIELTFTPELLLSNEGTCTVSFALRHADGTVTEPVTLTYKLDTRSPMGDVKWKGQSVLTDGSSAYCYFGKSAIQLMFEANDGEHASGIAKLEYALAENGPFTAITDGAATVATNAGAYTVWYRITDNAGNTTLLHTDGMILYADTTVADPNLTYERLSGQNASLQLTLNGNTPAVLLDANGDSLTAEQFAIDSTGQLTLKASYLELLPAGNHTLTLSVAPLGYTFISNSVNEAPAALALCITVNRRTPTVQDFAVTPPDNTVYDGSSKSVTVSAPIGMGSITVFYVDASGTPHAQAKNAGTYTVKIDVAMGTDYSAYSGLALGQLVIGKMTPAAPELTYDAATGLLSGNTAGLVYAKDGGAYATLPEHFLDIVTDTCLLYFYLPGDGLNTENSEIAVISVTRAASPTATPTDETLFATCDGKITCSASGIEYRHVNEAAWIAVEGTVITNLAPATYEIRIAAKGTVLESPAVQVVIGAAPEFISLEREASLENQPTVVIKGDLTALSGLSLIGLTADAASPSALRSLSVIDQRTTRIIGFFDLVLEGRHSGTLTVDIAVGDAYNGQTLTVHRERQDGSTEVLSVPCENGKITLTMDALSPILITTPMTTPHGVGSTAWIVVLVVIGVLILGTCVALEILYRKRKKQ